MLERHAPAKINLGLHVLRQRPDGYHDIETVFLRIPWADRVTAEPADDLSMTCSDPSLPTDDGNLCMQAAQRLAEAFDVDAGAALHLEKQVPYGAGLGSGSSDAAATLELLNAMWEVGAPHDALQAIGAEIGSDVPFFLQPEMAAYATGRGDQLTPLYDAADEPYRCPFALVVAVPPVQIATPEAYQRVTPQEKDRPDLRAIVSSNDLARWRTELVNDFDTPIRDAYPEVQAAARTLTDAGAAYVSLSGSGSAVFGVFAETGPARTAAEALAEQDCRTRVIPA